MREEIITILFQNLKIEFSIIPINERSLNPNLTQNDGWDDGLDF